MFQLELVDGQTGMHTQLPLHVLFSSHAHVQEEIITINNSIFLSSSLNTSEIE